MKFKTCKEAIGFGTCKADCCGIVPIPKATYEANKDKLKRPVLQEIEFINNTIVPITANNKCPFLQDDMKCAIYEERPFVCRKFGSGDPHPRLQCPHGIVTMEAVKEELFRTE